MKFLLLSDIHGNTENLDKIDFEFKTCDAVLFAGDFSKFEHPETALPVLEKLLSKHQTIASVLGNCDEPEFLKVLEEKDVCAENAFNYYNHLGFLGSGGGSIFTQTTPNERTDEELVSDLEKFSEALALYDNLSTILIMHNPPKDTKCDMVAPDVHVGSPLLRKFIEDNKPLFVLTGHIHESVAIDKIGETTIVNPGSLADGKYAVMELEKDNDAWKIKSVELKTI